MRAHYHALRLALIWAGVLAMVATFEAGLFALHLERWWRQQGRR